MNCSTELAKLKQQLANATSERDRQEAIIVDLRKQLSQTVADLKHAKKQHAEAALERDQLRVQAATLGKDYEENLQELARLRRSFAEASVTVETQQQANDETIQELSSSKNRQIECRNQLQYITEERDALGQLVKDLEAKYGEVVKELASANQRIASLQEELRTSEEKLKQVSIKYEEALKELPKMERKLSELSSFGKYKEQLVKVSQEHG